MTLNLLSDVLDATICPASKSRTPDDFFAIGCAMIGSWVHGKDPATQADYQRQGQGIAVLRDFIKPSRPGDGVKDEYKVFGTSRTVVNDLFVPGYRMDVDGFMHIYFPVPVWTPLSSSFLSRDWRFVALAWIAVIDSGLAPAKMVFVAADAAGRRVMSVVEPEVLDAFKTMLKAKPRDIELPGPACVRCVKAEVCDTLQRVLDPHMEGAAERLPKDKTAVAQALFFQRMELETRIEVLEEQKKKTDQLLSKLCVDGVLRIGGESIQIPSRKSNHWDYSKVRHILEPAGLWSDSFGSVKGMALQASMAQFPADVRKRLEDAVVVTTNEPSISEAIRHGRVVNKAPLLRGLA
jgi:hypothetical protein